MQSEGPYKADEQALGGWLLDWREAQIANLAFAEGRASVEKYTIEMLKFATDEVKKCHEQIRQLEEKYARNVYVMPPGKPSFDQKEHDALVEKGTKAWGQTIFSDRSGFIND